MSASRSKSRLGNGLTWHPEWAETLAITVAGVQIDVRPRFAPVDFVILGRRDIFMRFKIEFDERARLTRLTPYDPVGGPSARYNLGAMPDRSRKRPRDANQLAKLIVDIATGEADDGPIASTKDPAAVALGRKGGLKGGKARAERMSPEQRSEAARRAAKARWSARDDDGDG